MADTDIPSTHTDLSAHIATCNPAVMHIWSIVLETLLLLLGAHTIVVRANLKYGTFVRRTFTIRNLEYINFVPRIFIGRNAVVPTRSKPAFLKLPGELRSKIYRLALITDKRAIRVSKGRSFEPALLSTCRQIQEEATNIFYLANNWTVDFYDWDYSVYQAFMHHVRVERGMVDFSRHQTENFWMNTGSLKKKKGNLCRLLRFLHETDDCSFFDYETDKGPYPANFTAVFGILSRMKKHPWCDFEPVLEIYLTEIARRECGWDWEE